MIFLADTHLNSNREVFLDFLKAVDTQEIKAKKIFFMGDMFDFLAYEIEYSRTFYAKAIDKVSKLQELIDTKEFIQAFAYTEQYPYLKKMHIYKQLEDHWNSIFNRVRRLIEEDPVFNVPKAQELLKPYFKVASKKELVVNMLSNFDKFSFASKYVKERNFVKYFALCKQFPFLEGTQLYEKVQAVGAKLYSDLLNMEQKGEYKNAASLIKILVSFEQYKEKIDDIVMDMKYKTKFVEAVKAGVTAQAYSILATYDKARF